MLFHEFTLNPESSTFSQLGGGEAEEKCFHHEIKPQNTKNTLKVESGLLSALLAFTGVNFHVNFHVFCFLCFLQAGSLPKSLFLSVDTFVDSEHIWIFSWKHVFWGFRGHFDVILKSILKKSLRFILLFDLKLLLWSRTMYLKHKICLDFHLNRFSMA